MEVFPEGMFPQIMSSLTYQTYISSQLAFTFPSTFCVHIKRGGEREEENLKNWYHFKEFWLAVYALTTTTILKMMFYDGEAGKIKKLLARDNDAGRLELNIFASKQWWNIKANLFAVDPINQQ